MNLLRYLIYVLIFIVSLFGISLIKRQQIKKNREQISQIEKSLQNLQIIIAADSIRMVVVNKVSSIISKYNSNLDESVRQKYATEIYKMTLKYDNLDVDLISATITHESAKTWDSTIVSHAGAMGLMQIMPPTGILLSQQEGIKWTNSKNMLFDPIINIRLGSRYLSMLITKYSLNMNKKEAVEAALAAYNGGERRVAYWLKRNRNNKYLYKETRIYIPRVLDLYEEFSAITM